jgi:hypothetical protein
MLLAASILVGKVYGEEVLILNKNKQIGSIGNKNVFETCRLPLRRQAVLYSNGTGTLPYNSFRYMKGTMARG